MKKNIAFFDFDGTITRKDSMIEFIRFCKGKDAYYKALIILSPWLGAMKLGIIPAARAKEKLLTHFFKGMPLKEFNTLCKKFAEEQLDSLIRTDALEKIYEHVQNGDEVVVVSASAENWISDWCNKTGIKYIGTRLLTDEDNRITGQLNGANCNGQEKVNRIILSYDPADYNNIYCYGDTSGDSYMLKLATHPFYRCFTR